MQHINHPATTSTLSPSLPQSPLKRKYHATPTEQEVITPSDLKQHKRLRSASGSFARSASSPSLPSASGFYQQLQPPNDYFQPQQSGFYLNPSASTPVSPYQAPSPEDIWRGRSLTNHENGRTPISSDEDMPKTPINLDEDVSMEWEETNVPDASPLLDHASTVQALSSVAHRFHLMRDSEPPQVTTITSPFFATTDIDSRNPLPSQATTLRVEVAPRKYTLSADLPGYSPEEMTISCRGTSVLNVVADQWGMQRACRHEWKVQFDDDVDLSNVKASFEQGVLRLEVLRYRTSVPIEVRQPSRPPFRHSNTSPCLGSMQGRP